MVRFEGDVLRTRRGWPHAIKGPYVVEMHWALSDEEPPRVICVGAALKTYADADDPQLEDYLGPRPGDRMESLTAEMWRGVKLGEIVDDERKALAPLIATQWPEVAAAWARPRPRALRRKRRDHAKVAEVYKDAWRRGNPPILAIAKAFRVEHTTARGMAARARAAGYLPPTSRGRPNASPAETADDTEEKP